MDGPLDVAYVLQVANKEKKLTFAAAVRIGRAFLIAFAFMTTAFARERGPRVEVVCPSPPIPVNMNKQQVLAYELHITNFDLVPLTLKRLEVSASEGNSKPLTALSDDKLSAAIVRVGVMTMSSGAGQAQDNRVIAPGARSVVFLWVELPSSGAIPVSLKHRMVFSVAGAGGPSTTATTLDSLEVPIKHEAAVELSPPFKGGTWLAGSGPSNNSDHRRTITAIDGRIYSAERFAIDWVKVGPNGDSRHEGAARNENWWGWGEPVLAVADGEITEVVDGIPDNTPRVLPPVTLDNIAGNHVILRVAPDRYVTYAHLQNASVKVQLHDHVRQGDVLALLGNSGNSTGSHLHMQVTDRNSVLQAQGVPFVFEKFTYFGPGSDYEPNKHVSEPWAQSIPAGDAVLEFETVSSKP